MWGAREMGYRVVFWDCLWFLVWALVCFILLKTFGFNILLSSLGVVFGLVYGISARASAQSGRPHINAFQMSDDFFQLAFKDMQTRGFS